MPTASLLNLDPYHPSPTYTGGRIELDMFQGKSICFQRWTLEHLVEHPGPLIAAKRRALVEVAGRMVFHFPLGTEFF
jgi:hypothetical protein